MQNGTGTGLADQLAICTRDPTNGLIAAECRELTASEPDASGRAFCGTLDQIPNAAYLRYGARCIVQTRTLDALVEWLRQARFQATDFRLKILGCSGEGLPAKEEATVAIANAIDGRPDLDRPQRQFLLTVCRQTFWFGEILVEATQSYRPHEAKPYRTAGSLPARLARALVNLVAPSAASILNPCCGTGSILLEACALGLEAHGADWSPRMAGMSARNLAHFDYGASVERVDAREWTRKADALIADLPYGRDRRALDETTLRQLLSNAAARAPVAVFVAAEDLTAGLEQAGFRNVELFRVKKTRGFTRYVHRARSGVHP